MEEKTIEEALGNANSIIAAYFTSPELFLALREKVPDEDISLMIENSSRFYDIKEKERAKRQEGNTSGLLGEEAEIHETKHDNCAERRAESGYRVNVDYLRTVGIDPSKVLFFRATQPSDKPKPEYYWTSDYVEALIGLSREISPEQRMNCVILVADLETISQNKGLIQDMNDDSGLAVRQIGTGTFCQQKAITMINPDYDEIQQRQPVVDTSNIFGK